MQTLYFCRNATVSLIKTGDYVEIKEFGFKKKRFYWLFLMNPKNHHRIAEWQAETRLEERGGKVSFQINQYRWNYSSLFLSRFGHTRSLHTLGNIAVSDLEYILSPYTLDRSPCRISQVENSFRPSFTRPEISSSFFVSEHTSRHLPWIGVRLSK